MADSIAPTPVATVSLLTTRIFFFFSRGHMWAHNNNAQSIINIMMMMTIND